MQLASSPHLQVLSPTKDRTLEIGTPGLNQQLQPIMNPASTGDSWDRWNSLKVRDRVIQVGKLTL